MSDIARAKSELCDATAAFSQCKSQCTEDRRTIKADREAANAVIMQELSAIPVPLKAMHLESGKIVKIHVTTSSRALTDAKIAAATEAITEDQISEYLAKGVAGSVAEATALAFSDNIKAECLSQTSAPKIVSKLAGSAAMPRKASRKVENAVKELDRIKARQQLVKDKMDLVTDQYETCKGRTEPVISAHMAATGKTEVEVEPVTTTAVEEGSAAMTGVEEGSVAVAEWGEESVYEGQSTVVSGPSPSVATNEFPLPQPEAEAGEAPPVKMWDQMSTTSTSICAKTTRAKKKKPTVQQFAEDMVRMIGQLEISSVGHVCSQTGRRTIKEMGAQRLAELTQTIDPVKRLVVVNK